MSFLNYLRGKLIDIVVHLLVILLTSVIVISYSVPTAVIYMLCLVYIVIFAVYYYFDFRKIKNKFNNYYKMINSLDKKYLFPELLSNLPLEENEWVKLIKIMEKSMVEEVKIEKKDKSVYKDYIEVMIHEIKNPLATINLICDNNKDDTSRKITIQTEQISNLIEQALYLAKLENMERDYYIKETKLERLVSLGIMQNRGALLENDFLIETSNLDFNIYTDEKWATFIINQLISNSIKYRSNHPKIIFKGNKLKDAVELSVIDNGQGFNKHEIDKVLEKGYTGERAHNLNSTGMGLYITRILGERLNISISIDRNTESGASVKLIFPVEDFNRQL